MKRLHEPQISMSIVFLGHGHAHVVTLLIWHYDAGGEECTKKPYDPGKQIFTNWSFGETFSLLLGTPSVWPS